MLIGVQGHFSIAIELFKEPRVFFVPDIAEAFVGEQSKDVVLEVCGINGAAQQVGGPPQVAFEFR